jgi:hypothetical protein
MHTDEESVDAQLETSTRSSKRARMDYPRRMTMMVQPAQPKRATRRAPSEKNDEEASLASLSSLLGSVDVFYARLEGDVTEPPQITSETRAYLMLLAYQLRTLLADKIESAKEV